MLIYANTFMEELATYLIFGCIAAAWLVTFITDKIFGLGFYPWPSTVLESLTSTLVSFSDTPISSSSNMGCSERPEP